MYELSDYRRILDNEGPAGLAYLNGRVPHRFTGVYRLTDGVLRNQHLFDKQGEVMPAFLAEVPLQESFCQFVLRDGFFLTSDTSKEGMLGDHKYRGVLLTYHGVPVLDNSAQLWGTLCHFDAASHELPAGEFEFLQEAAKMLPPFLGRSKP